MLKQKLKEAIAVAEKFNDTIFINTLASIAKRKTLPSVTALTRTIKSTTSALQYFLTPAPTEMVEAVEVLTNLAYRYLAIEGMPEDKKCSCDERVKLFYCSCGYEDYNEALHFCKTAHLKIMKERK